MKKIRWYNNEQRELMIMSGVCLWYASKCIPITICWVLVKNDNGKLDAFFSTNPSDDPVKIIEIYIMRWNVEVTFQESRNHLGFETQRQWSDKAITRTTPIILGLYSLVSIMAIKMKAHAKTFAISSAWYVKNDFAAFSDVLAVVRRGIWSSRYFSNSPLKGKIIKISTNDFNFIINQRKAIFVKKFSRERYQGWSFISSEICFYRLCHKIQNTTSCVSLFFKACSFELIPIIIS